MTYEAKSTKEMEAQAKPPAKGSKIEKTPCNAYFAFLFQLQKSGSVNLYEVVPMLMKNFPELDQEDAERTLLYWMQNYDRIEKE